MSQAASVDIIILGAGWTSTFLIPLLERESISYAATTTTGRDETYKFKFDQSDDLEQYKALPSAKTVLITFPLKGTGQSKHLRTSYLTTHAETSPSSILFIQLGSTGIFEVPNHDLWITRHSKYNTTNDRAIAEDELLKLGGNVMNLSGLWGGARDPRNWVERVAPTKEKLGSKTSLHLIHGADVARGIVAVHRKPTAAAGQRYMLTNLMVYDWWALILDFADDGDKKPQSETRFFKQIEWLRDLMVETDTRALPRSPESLGRCYDSREFWNTFDIMPVHSNI